MPEASRRTRAGPASVLHVLAALLVPAAIIGGIASDDATVVALRVRAACDQPAIVVCTGVVVAPRAVVTAAHCAADTPLGLLEIVRDTDATAPAAPAVRIADAWFAPDADLAVLALTAPLDAPLATRGAPPVDGAGATVTILGYGDGGDGEVGTRRAGTATLAAIGDATVTLAPGPALTCGGDSGGPVVHAGAVIAVTSFGDPACEISTTAVRLDVHAGFVDDAIMMASMLPEGVPGPGEADCGVTEDDGAGCRASGPGAPGAAVLVLLALVAACGSSSRPRGPCGDGVQHGDAPPKGTLLWCADAAGVKHGPMREWWPDGTPRLDAVYVRGKQHGPFTRWYEGGARQEAGEMAEGLRVGTWTEWYEDGKRKRESKHGDGAVVTWTLYREDDGTKWVEGAFRNQREHGRFVEYYPDGARMAEGEFVDGKKADGWSYWTPDGQRSEVELGSYASGAFGADADALPSGQ